MSDHIASHPPASDRPLFKFSPNEVALHHRHRMTAGELDQLEGGTVSHLWLPDFDDPGGRDDDSGVGPQRTRLLDLVQHEARHLVVELEDQRTLTFIHL